MAQTWPLRLITLLVWALVLFSATAWALHAMAGEGAALAPAAPASAPQPPADAVAVALGARNEVAAAAAPAQTQYRLLGLVTEHPSGQGAALISINGQTPKPYRVGASLTQGVVLQSLDTRSARLGPTLDGKSDLELTLVSAASNPAGTALAPPPVNFNK